MMKQMKTGFVLRKSSTDRFCFKEKENERDNGAYYTAASAYDYF